MEENENKNLNQDSNSNVNETPNVQQPVVNELPPVEPVVTPQNEQPTQPNVEGASTSYVAPDYSTNPNGTTKNSNPKKKGKAGKIIGIIVIVILLVAAIVMGLDYADILDINLSKKAKLEAGLSKVGESVTGTLDDVKEERDGFDIQALDEDLSKYSTKVDASVKLKKLDVEGVPIDEDTLKSVKKLLSELKFETITNVDNGKIDAIQRVKLNDTTLSIEGILNEEGVAVRSKELNEDWLSLNFEEIKDMLEDEGIPVDAVNFDSKELTKLFEKIKIKDDELDYIEKQYADILKNEILELDMEKEKDKITIDGKKHTCDKITVELKEKDVKRILKKYVDTFAKDKKTQKMIIDRMTAIIDYSATIVENAADVSGFEEEVDFVKEQLEKAFSKENMDLIRESIDEITLNGTKIELNIYSTSTKIYATELILTNKDTEDLEYKLVAEYPSKGKTKYYAEKVNGDETTRYFQLVVENEKNHKNAKLTIPSGYDDDKEMSIELDYKIEKDIEKAKLTIDFTEGKIVFDGKLEYKENTKDKLAVNANLNVDFEAAKMVDVEVEFDSNLAIDLKDVKVRSLPESTIDVTGFINGEYTSESDEIEELEEYKNTVLENAIEISDKLGENELLEDLMSEASDFLEEAKDVTIAEMLEGEIVPQNPYSPSVPSFPTDDDFEIDSDLSYETNEDIFTRHDDNEDIFTAPGENKDVKTLKVGEKWVVDGLWEFTIDSVEKTDYRDEFDKNTNPAEVVIVTYSYKNLGYKGFADSNLYFYLKPGFDATYVDGSGEVGKNYFYTDYTSPDEVPVGAKCTGATVAVALKNPSDTLEILVTHGGNDYTDHKVKYIADIK